MHNGLENIALLPQTCKGEVVPMEGAPHIFSTRPELDCGVDSCREGADERNGAIPCAWEHIT
jgi:hypothetical protein